MLLILLNTVTASLSAGQFHLMILIMKLTRYVELHEDERDHWQMFQTIQIIELLSVIIYSAEIILKWLDDFEGFWKDGWNIFDLFVTVAVSRFLIKIVADY
jgi:hypothetical protein